MVQSLWLRWKSIDWRIKAIIIPVVLASAGSGVIWYFGHGRHPTSFFGAVFAAGIGGLAKDWNIQYSQGMPPHPSAEGSGWYFDFPKGSNCAVKEKCPGVHYVTTRYTEPIAQGSFLTISFKILTDGNPTFNYKLEESNSCNFPATVRAFLQRANDDMYAANNRYWSNPSAVVLAPGEFALKIKVVPDQWSNVEGRFGGYDSETKAGFQKTLDTMGNIGITFGGGCFFGHGVNVSGGTARFTMTGFELTTPVPAPQRP